MMGNWTKIKPVLNTASKDDLIKLIGELESLSQANRGFLEARFLHSPDIVKRDKEAIRKYVAPSEPWKKSQQVNLREARKIISNYKKASADVIGLIDLMVYYVECGTDFINEFGDMEESYYNSMESMFDSVLKLMQKQDGNEMDDFIHRLKFLVQGATEGYGYYDTLSGLLEDAYPAMNKNHIIVRPTRKAGYNE